MSEAGLMAEGISYLDPNPGGERMILMLHGLGADKGMWGYQLPAFCDAGLRPVAVDLPGFGESPFGGKRWRVADTAKRLMDFARSLSPGVFDVMGLSLGGVVAQQMALDHPGQIQRLVLVSTFASLRPKSMRTAIYFLLRFTRAMFNGPEKQAHMVAWHIFPAEGQAGRRDELVRCILQSDPKAYQSAMRQIALFDSRRRLPALRVPTLVMGGADDQTAPVSAQTELAGCIPGARQIIIPQAGHALPIDQPELFNQAVIGWLTS